MKNDNEWDYDQIDVRKLMPQAYPFLFVDQILQFNVSNMSCTSKFRIKEDTLLMENNRLSESGLLENIAQTCAVHIGFYNKYILKREIQVGFIGAVKNMRIFDKVNINDDLLTTITIKTEFGGMKIADAQIICNQKIVAEGELKIALQD
jgi:predicted hotdog family 3-hydroxylacyl-ACP dehydratase